MGAVIRSHTSDGTHVFGPTISAPKTSDPRNASSFTSPQLLHHTCVEYPSTTAAGLPTALPLKGLHLGNCVGLPEQPLSSPPWSLLTPRLLPPHLLRSSHLWDSALAFILPIINSGKHNINCRTLDPAHLDCAQIPGDGAVKELAEIDLLGNLCPEFLGSGSKFVVNEETFDLPEDGAQKFAGCWFVPARSGS